MGKDSNIQWTDHTWNPWHGCIKVSPGCKYCYMFRDKERYGQDPTVVMRSKSGFNAPLKIKEPSLVFTCSWSDFFIEEADEWRWEAWEIIKYTPHLTYQILTKRPERIAECLPDDWGDGYPNVWLGVSVENQALLSKRMHLLNANPARIKFLSIEPILEHIKLIHPDLVVDKGGIDWIIVGGESGNDSGKYTYRSCSEYDIKGIIIDGRALNIPVFVKQLGTNLSKKLRLKDRHGGDINEWPYELQVRQMPRGYDRKF